MITAVRCMSMLSRANIARFSLAALIVTTAHGQTWNGAGANNLWNNGGASGNWTAAAAPVNNGTANVAFGGSTRLTPDMDANWSINSLTFNSGAGAFVLGSTGAFTLTMQTGGITNNSSNTQTINNAIALGAAQTWSTIGGALSFGSTATVNLGANNLTVGGSFTTTMTGAISSSFSGGGLTVNGGTVLLNAASTEQFFGATNVANGTLELNIGGFGLQNSAALNIGDGVGAAATAVVKEDQPGQLHGGSSNMTVNLFSDGQLNVNNNTEGVGALNFTGGSVTTGTATLSLNGNLTTNASSSTATITGNLNPFVTRTFTVASGSTGNGIDLDVSAVISNGGIIKAGAGTLRLSGPNTFPGGLTLNAGTLAVGNVAAAGTGTLTLSGGTIQADTSARTLSNPVAISGDTTVGGSLDITFGGPASVTGNRTLTVNNAGMTTFSGVVTLAASNSLTKTGTGTLTFSQLNTIGGTFNLNAGTFAAPNNVTFSSTGTFTENAGTFTGGTLVNQGSFVYNGGTFNGQLQNNGSATFNANFMAGNGLTNSTNITVGNAVTLTLNGTGLDNEGSVSLNGGALAGGGLLANNSSITGTGTIAGSGGFTNNATLTASGGNFTLSNSGTNTNNGTITLPNGFQFRVTSTTLNNSGTINLNSATLAGTGTLANLAAGVVDGPGTISAATFTNSGIVQPGKGTLNIVNAWTNSGALQLTDFTSNVTGGTITNAGQIQGQGSIGAPLVNNATIAPSGGGTLNVGGAFQNNASGLVRVSSGNTLAALSGLATNAGIINLTGGTFDNNGGALNNTGQVSGYGTLSTGGLTNNGSVTFTGGTTTVNGDVTNASSKTVRILYNPAIFTGNVTNNGTFKTTSTTATFAGTFTNNGTFSSDPATQYFQDLKVGATGALQGGVGDLFVINGNLTSNSTQNSAFNISGAQLTLANGAHNVTWSGVDLGPGGSGFNNNFAIGIFELGPQAILQMLGGALYVHEFRLDGGLSELANISDSHNIYYDANDPANAYLNDKTYSLNGGGFLLPASGLGVVPEPGTTALLMFGALAVGIYAGRRSRA